MSWEATALATRGVVMNSFGSAIAGADTGAEAARHAARAAAAQVRAAPVLAVVFASPGYEDLDQVPAAVRAELGVPVVGGTAGGLVIGPGGVMPHGVGVVVLGGDLEASAVTTRIVSSDLLELVGPAKMLSERAEQAAARGLTEFTCLAFAPGLACDGEAMVAAVRKGAGPRAQLAGALTGDDFTFDRTRVFDSEGVYADHVVLTGLFTRTPLGIAARHGYRAAGPLRTVTRADGAWLLELDGRPAFDVWADDVSMAGGELPSGRGMNVAQYLANNFELGVEDDRRAEPVVRAPFAIRDDGAVRMSASIGEGVRTRLMHATRDDLLEAARDAARQAAGGTREAPAGALVLACTGRMATLGDGFAEEPAAIARLLQAPVGGACVFGEIARARRDADAFHNTTTVVVAIPSA